MQKVCLTVNFFRDTHDEKNILPKKKACVLQLGCPESGIDAAKVQVFLKKNGYDITRKWKEADIVFLRTCGLTKNSVTESLNAIKSIKKGLKKNTEFYAWGCLSKINLKALQNVYDGITFGEKDIGVLNEIIETRIPIEKVRANFVLSKYRKKTANPVNFLEALIKKFYPPYEQKPDKFGPHFNIKVSTGCLCGGYNERCAYCSVREARGIIRSEDIDEIMCQFENGIKLGFRDFRLIGTDLGATGRDKGYTLAELSNRMIDRSKMLGIKIVLSWKNVNGYWLTKDYDELRPILLSGKIRYLASPIEHASNRILIKMRRNYTAEQFNSIIADINRKNHSILLCTQLITGFPGETDEDHNQNEMFVRRPLFDAYELYQFSPRQGTPAFKMSGQVPEDIKRKRYARLKLIAIMSMTKRKTMRSLIKS